MPRSNEELRLAEISRLERDRDRAERREEFAASMVQKLRDERGYDEFETFDDTDGYKSIRMRTPAQIQEERDELRSEIQQAQIKLAILTPTVGQDGTLAHSVRVVERYVADLEREAKEWKWKAENAG